MKRSPRAASDRFSLGQAVGGHKGEPFPYVYCMFGRRRYETSGWRPMAVFPRFSFQLTKLGMIDRGDTKQMPQNKFHRHVSQYYQCASAETNSGTWHLNGLVVWLKFHPFIGEP